MSTSQTHGHLIGESKDACTEAQDNNKSKKEPETKIDAGILCVLQMLIMHNADNSRLKRKDDAVRIPKSDVT